MENFEKTPTDFSIKLNDEEKKWSFLFDEHLWEDKELWAKAEGNIFETKCFGCHSLQCLAYPCRKRSLLGRKYLLGVCANCMKRWGKKRKLSYSLRNDYPFPDEQQGGSIL